MPPRSPRDHIHGHGCGCDSVRVTQQRPQARAAAEFSSPFAPRMQGDVTLPRHELKRQDAAAARKHDILRLVQEARVLMELHAQGLPARAGTGSKREIGETNVVGEIQISTPKTFLEQAEAKLLAIENLSIGAPIIPFDLSSAKTRGGGASCSSSRENATYNEIERIAQAHVEQAKKDHGASMKSRKTKLGCEKSSATAKRLEKVKATVNPEAFWEVVRKCSRNECDCTERINLVSVFATRLEILLKEGVPSTSKPGTLEKSAREVRDAAWFQLLKVGIIIL